MSTPTYRISAWPKTFETADSRRYKHLPWISVPTKQGGKGRRRLVRRSNGPALFGAWVALAQVAANMPERGTLADEDGPLTPEDLEILTDIPSELYEELLDLLSDPKHKIQWLEVVDAQHENDSDPGGKRRGEESCRDTESESESESETRSVLRIEEQSACQSDSDLDEIAYDAPPADSGFLISGDSDSPSPDRRPYLMARHKFLTEVGKLYSRDQVQERSDRTTATRWFDELIWPGDIDTDIALDRLDRFYELLAKAKRNAKNPMAYIAKQIERTVKAA